MNIERLEKLLEIAKEIPEDRLHMRKFCETATCGTAYCLAGWAAVNQWFRENTEIDEVFGIIPYKGQILLSNLLDPEETFCALAQIFDISLDDSDNLFGAKLSLMGDDPHVVSKAEVIENIQCLLAGVGTFQYDAVIDGLDEQEIDPDW